MIINKITYGFVVQTFDTDLGTFISQEFVGSDDREWEYADYEQEDVDDGKDPVDVVTKDGEDEEPYLNFDMVQPD